MSLPKYVILCFVFFIVIPIECITYCFFVNSPVKFLNCQYSNIDGPCFDEFDCDGGQLCNDGKCTSIAPGTYFDWFLIWLLLSIFGATIIIGGYVYVCLCSKK